MPTLTDAQAAATAAGRAHAASEGRPPAPWTREDLDAANAAYHGFCRQHKIGMYGNQPMLPARKS